MVVTRAAPASAILLFLSAGQCRISVCRARLLLVEEWLVSLLVVGVGLPMPLFSFVLSHPDQEEPKGQTGAVGKDGARVNGHSRLAHRPVIIFQKSMNSAPCLSFEAALRHGRGWFSELK